MSAGAGFGVDPTRLRAAARRFDVVADQLHQAGTALRSALGAEGECWGGDAAGRVTAQSYCPQAERTARALGTLAEALRATRTGLDASAGTADGAGRSGAGRFGTGNGGPR